MDSEMKGWAKDTVFLALCWFCAVWMPLYLPADRGEAEVAVVVYGLIIVALGLSEKRAIRKGKRRVDVSWAGLVPVWLGYSVTIVRLALA